MNWNHNCGVWVYQSFYRQGLEYKYLPNPSTQAGNDPRSIFIRSLRGLNAEFSFALIGFLTEAKKPSLLYYLLLAGRRIIEFIPFPRVLVLCEMQRPLSRMLNSGRCIHSLSTTVTIIHWVPPFYFFNPSARAGCDTGSIFKAEFYRFEFRVFLLLDRLPY